MTTPDALSALTIIALAVSFGIVVTLLALGLATLRAAWTRRWV